MLISFIAGHVFAHYKWIMDGQSSNERELERGRG